MGEGEGCQVDRAGARGLEGCGDGADRHDVRAERGGDDLGRRQVQRGGEGLGRGGDDRARAGGDRARDHDPADVEQAPEETRHDRELTADRGRDGQGPRVAGGGEVEDGLGIQVVVRHVGQRAAGGQGARGDRRPRGVDAPRRQAVRAADALDAVERDRLSGSAVRAAEEAPVEPQPGTEPLSREEGDEVVVADGGALRVLGDRGERGVVLDPDDRRPRREGVDEVGVHALPESVVVRGGAARAIDGGGHAEAYRDEIVARGACPGQGGVDDLLGGAAAALGRIPFRVDRQARGRDGNPAEVGDGRRDVSAAGIHADDESGVGAEREAARRSPLGVFAHGPGVRHLDQQPAGDQLVEHVDRRRPGQCDRGHDVARRECLGVPRVGEHGVEAVAAERGNRGCGIRHRILTPFVSPAILPSTH